jgi:quinoprotein glucose dehydrogenase
MNWHFALIRYLMLTTILNAVLLAGTANANNSSAYQSGEDWPWYHGNPHATHYSTLDHINKKM